MSIRELELIITALQSYGRLHNGTAASAEMRELHDKLLKEHKERTET